MYSVLGHERASCIERFGCSAQRSAEHDVPRAALLALRQRRGYAARQGLAGHVPRVPRSLHHQRRPRGDLALGAVPEALRQRDSRVAARQPVLPLGLRHRAARDRRDARARQAAPLCDRASNAPASSSIPTFSRSASPAASPPTSAPRCSSATASVCHDLAERIGGLQILLCRQGAPRRQRGQGAHPRRLRRRREVPVLEAAASSTSRTTTGTSASNSPMASMCG